MTELNIAWNTGESFVDIFGGLWLADYVGAFLTAGGDGLYYFHYLPVGLYTGLQPAPAGPSACSPSTRATRSSSPRRNSSPASCSTQEWVQPGNGDHRVFPAASDVVDPAGHVLVTAYALERPDGQWSLLVVNKDQENAHPVRISFGGREGAERAFAGPVTVTTFGAAQYQWHARGRDGRADPDGPAARSTVAATQGTVFDLPKASITVIRGAIAAAP